MERVGRGALNYISIGSRIERDRWTGSAAAAEERAKVKWSKGETRSRKTRRRARPRAHGNIAADIKAEAARLPLLFLSRAKAGKGKKKRGMERERAHDQSNKICLSYGNPFINPHARRDWIWSSSPPLHLSLSLFSSWRESLSAGPAHIDIYRYEARNPRKIRQTFPSLSAGFFHPRESACARAAFNPSGAMCTLPLLHLYTYQSNPPPSFIHFAAKRARRSFLENYRDRFQLWVAPLRVFCFCFLKKILESPGVLV